MRTLHWGYVWAQDERTGAWLEAQVRPAWYWFLRRVKLFCRIVWRRYEVERIPAPLAWDISAVAVGVVGPISVRRAELRPSR